MSYLAGNIRFLRKQRNEKQEDVSMLFQKKANTVGNWENRKSEPSVQEIVKLAAHFGIGVDELLTVDLSLGIGTAYNKEWTAPIAAKGAKDYPIQKDDWVLQENTDSFWVLIRELRAINEKLDDLKNTMAAARASDKSQH